MGTPLLGGDRGVAQTIDLMRKLVDDAVKDPFVNRSAIEMVRGAGDTFSREAKAQAIYNYLAGRWTYVEDPVGPFGPKETLRPPRALLEMIAGDCDDATLLIASLLGTIGIRARFITVAADASAPDEFSHIYPEAEIFPGYWVAMDIARPGSAFGLAPQRYFRKRAWDFDYDNSTDLANALSGSCGCGGACCSGRLSSRLSGYAVLGDDSVAQDIEAAGIAASDVAATLNPNVIYQTAYSPAGVAAPAGYPVTPSASLSASITPNAGILLLLGLGLVALMGAHR